MRYYLLLSIVLLVGCNNQDAIDQAYRQGRKEALEETPREALQIIYDEGYRAGCKAQLEMAAQPIYDQGYQDGLDRLGENVPPPRSMPIAVHNQLDSILDKRLK